MKKTLLILSAGLALPAMTACSSGGSGARTPDEFRVVTKAPLVVPPEYNLRPPGAGQAQPAEIDPTLTQTATAFGSTFGAGASASERALVAAADANAVSPVIRAQVDYEQAKIIRKSSSVSDQIIAWDGDAQDGPVSDSATAGEEVTIERGSGDRLKLPGT